MQNALPRTNKSYIALNSKCVGHFTLVHTILHQILEVRAPIPLFGKEWDGKEAVPKTAEPQSGSQGSLTLELALHLL